MSYNFILTFVNNTNKMSDSKPLLEKENTKMKDFIQKIKPREIKVFDRIKNRITKFFGNKFIK